MEDAATAEISRAQLWQWVKRGAALAATAGSTAELYRRIRDEELDEAGRAGAERYGEAAEILDGLVLADDDRGVPDAARLRPAALKRRVAHSPALRPSTSRGHTPKLLAAAFALAALIAGTVKIRSYDFFWHLESGQWILDHRALPETDPFRFTADPSERWIDHEWLAQVLLASGERTVGLVGLERSAVAPRPRSRRGPGGRSAPRQRALAGERSSSSCSPSC